MITNLQKDEYRKNKGKICPYCKEPAVRIVSKKSKEPKLKIINADRATQEMMCEKCKKRWKEVFPFFDIEEVEEKPNDEKSIR